MKKGPNLRWSLIQCSGGDEGDRTPDLLTASQALSQLSYAPVRRSTIRELPRRCKDNFGKTFAGSVPGAPDRVRSARKARGARPAGGRRRRPPFRRPDEASRPTARCFPLPGRGPPCARRPFHQRRSHYWARSRSDPTGHLKTMPDYGARPGTPEHAGISGNKTAGRRLAYLAKCLVWTAGLGSAP